VWRVLGGATRASVCLERSKSAPFGLAGGGAGGAGRIVVAAPDGTERELVSKGPFTAPPGALIALRAPGSGGYGAPGERAADRVREDVVNGYVSRDAAASTYGRVDGASLSCPACAAAQAGGTA
jgi:N-methylhydantoinase B